MSSSMDSMKNRLKRKYLPCTNPLANDDAPYSGSDSVSDGGYGRNMKSGNRSFYGSLKAVLFRTQLVKKLRSKKIRRDSYGSSIISRSSSKSREDVKLNPSKTKPTGRKRLEEILRDDDCDGYSLFSSTSASCASSVSSNSRCGSQRMKESAISSLESKQRNTNIVNRSGECGLYRAMWVVLVCLLSLVFGGKAFAIVTCTTTWLFFADR